MPMSQDDIRRHYEQNWKGLSAGATGEAGLAYSNPVEDAVLYPAYETLIRDYAIDTSSVLDVGSGSGRWIRFFLERFRPRRLVGCDFAAASVELLRKWHGTAANAEFRRADITDPSLDLGEQFSMINIANVLFHIPEQDRFTAALRNLAKAVTPGGRIITTEYLPRASMRTEWMLVRSRYEFGAAVGAAGLRVVGVRPFCFFANDPMGIDGPDENRRFFGIVRGHVKQVMESELTPAARKFMMDLFVSIELATVGYCAERVADVDMPSQKLVVLERK